MDSLEKVSGVREKEETHGEIGVRKGVERCCKIERGQETRPREGEKVKRGWERVKRERRKRRRGATKKNRRGYIGLSIREGSCLPSLSSFPNTPSLCPCLTPLSFSPRRWLSISYLEPPAPSLCAYVYARSRNTCQRLRKQND